MMGYLREGVQRLLTRSSSPRSLWLARRALHLKRGQLVEYEITDVAFGGEGVTRVDAAVLERVMSEHASSGGSKDDPLVLGDDAFLRDGGGLVMLTKRSAGGSPQTGAVVQSRVISGNSAKGHLDLRLRNVVKEHPGAVESPCRHFGPCGGCTALNVSYDEQLARKQQQVCDLFARIGGISDLPVLDILPCETTTAYRNKMEFSFAPKLYEGKPVLGLHMPGRFDRILRISDCQIQDPEANEILQAVSNFVGEYTEELPVYNSRKHRGLLRHVVIRTAENRNASGAYGGSAEPRKEIMVSMVTSQRLASLLTPLAQLLAERFPSVVSVMNVVNASKSAVAHGPQQVTLHGRPFLVHTMLGVDFQISHSSFFQTNAKQAPRLLSRVGELCELSDGDVVYDMFCGTGSIALCLSRQHPGITVFGADLEASAIADAQLNADNNEISNAFFARGDLHSLAVHELPFASVDAQGNETMVDVPPPSCVIVDPPRPGLHPRAIEPLLHAGARRIVYISCNPSTQARDVKLLLASGRYRLAVVQPVDMFPHTPHVENVCVLERV